MNTYIFSLFSLDHCRRQDLLNLKQLSLHFYNPLLVECPVQVAKKSTKTRYVSLLVKLYIMNSKCSSHRITCISTNTENNSFYDINSSDKNILTSYRPSARSVRQVMDRVFSFLLWPKRKARGPWKHRRKKTRIHNLPYGPSKRG